MQPEQPKKRQPGYLANNRKVNVGVALVGLVWAYLEWLSGSLVWCIAALFLVVLSVFNLLVKWDRTQEDTSPSLPD